MGVIFRRDYPAYIAILIISLMYWLGIASVPFHPDESTQIFMAKDLKTFFSRPGDLFWRLENAGDLRQYYREVDPPLTRYLIGIGLALAGKPTLDQDWDWSKTWRENEQFGALPGSTQLMAARLGAAFLFPISLLFAYLLGKTLRTRSIGWLSLALTALNALLLLHTRRAMAESALLFGISFSLWAMVAWKRGRYWLAVPVAIAFNAKYSALPLALIGLIAVLWDIKPEKTPLARRLMQGALYGAIFILVTYILNPFLWRSPVAALQDAFHARQDLVQRQTYVLGAASEQMVLETFGEKAEAALAQLFFAPPTIIDVGNYAEELRQPTERYLRNPLHTLLRSWTGGGLTFSLTLVGLILLVYQLIRSRSPARADTLVLAALLLQAAGIFVFIQFPFQRYYIPLVPFSSLLIAYAILTPFTIIKQKRSPERSRDLPV